MKWVLLACSTVRMELERALDTSGCVLDEVFWIESGLHDTPELLRKAIQRDLDRIEDGALVLCGFGSCGRAIVGVETKAHTLIVPRIDDCITWLAGSWEHRRQWEEDGAVYYMTPAWAEGEHSLYRDYCYAVGKYGKEMADEIFGSMLKHYRYLGIVDTGVFDFEEFAEKMKPAAMELKLEIKRCIGTLSWMEALFDEEQQDGERFLLVPPFTTVTAEMLV